MVHAYDPDGPQLDATGGAGDPGRLTEPAASPESAWRGSGP